MLRIFCAPLFLACLACGTLLSAEKMTTKVFKLPYNFMNLGTVGDPPPTSSEPPADPFEAPASVASPPSALTFKSSRQILEDTGLTFPPGASAIFDPVTRELTLHNTAEMQYLMEAFIDSINWHGSTPTFTFTVTLVEGRGEVIRQANAAASRNADAMPHLDALVAEAAKPGSGIQVIGEMSVEAESGTRATVEAVQERPRVGGHKNDAAAAAPLPKPESAQGDEEPELKPSWTRQDGMSLVLEPTLGADGKTLEVTLDLNLGSETPATESDDATAAATTKAGFVTGISMTVGSAKLIGITRPLGKDAELKAAGKDTLWAAFLTARMRHAKAPPGVIATPGVAQGKLPKGMRAVSFPMPEGLLDDLIPKDLFSRQPRPLKEQLEAVTSPFPEGASIEYRDGLLQMVNSPEMIERIAAVVDYVWANAPNSLAFTLHTFQVPATLLRPLIRQGAAAEEADDSTLLAAVEAAVTRGEARAVSSACFESKSGTRSRHESGLEHSLLTRFSATAAAGESKLWFQKQIVGDVLEIDSYVRADGRMVHLNCLHELHPAPPASHREHLRTTTSSKDHDLPGADVHVLRTVTATAMASGTARLLSLHPAAAFNDGAPEGGPGMLWATFLQAQVVPLVNRPPKVTEKPLTKKQADIQRLSEKMNKIILPEVTLQGATLEEALELLRVKSREADTSTNAEGEKGVSIVSRLEGVTIDAAITLDLKDVALSEALRYVTELSLTKYTVEAHAVLVVPFACDQASPQYTRTYQVGPDFLSIGDNDAVSASTGPFTAAAPVGAVAQGPKVVKTVRRVLEAQGITFPEGASASFIANTNTLVVRNTQPNLDLIEAFGCFRGPRPVTTVALTAQVLQGPGPLLRRMAAQAAPLNDHRALLEELLAAVKTGTVQALDTARIETKSGTRATTEQGRDVAALTGLTLDGKGGAALERAAVFSGMRLELEPLLGPDGVSISLTLDAEHHTAPPVPRQEHLMDDQGRRFEFPLTDTHRAHLVTELTILDGQTRLLHLWKPTGNAELEKEDLLQVMFLTGDVLRGAEE